MNAFANAERISERGHLQVTIIKDFTSLKLINVTYILLATRIQQYRAGPCTNVP